MNIRQGLSRYTRTLIAFAVLLAAPLLADDVLLTPRERYTCDKEVEEKHFGSWSRMAGDSSETKIKKKYPNARIVSVGMPDERTIRGIQFPATPPLAGAVIVIPGNAWLAEDFADYADAFTAIHLDVFLFDFRGYGLSKPGVPTLSAIIDDYRDLAAWLDKQYKQKYLYAFSFGGVVALNAFPNGQPFTRMVVDATPARLGDLKFTCSVSYDPVDKLPGACPYLTMMHGTRDWILPRRVTQELITKVQSCGGEVDIAAPRGHPFQVEWRSTRRKRLADIVRHLLGAKP